MNGEREIDTESDFGASEYRGGKKEDKEFGQSDILADTQKRCKTQDEFVCLLYNDIAKHFLENRCQTELPESVSTIEFRDESSRENDGSKKSKESGNNEKSFDKDSRPSVRKSSSPDKRFEVEFPNKNTYVGHVSRGQMEGNGVYRWGSGETYKGEFERNSIEGKGHIEWKDQSWYEGEFHKGHRHGNGNYVSHEYRRFYIGQWHMGRKHGNGYCRYGKNDDFYEGEWNMDEKHGTGFRVYENGTRYIGQWEDDQRNGVGTMVWPNGDVYRGEWKDGKMNGYGEYVWKGFFNQSLSWPRENIYMGEWLNGMRHGRGDLKFNSTGGAKYSGDWYMDKKHGRGMIIGNNGAVTEADPLFLNDILMPLDTDASDYRKLDSKFAARDSKGRIKERESSHHSAATETSGKVKEPRRTAVFDPLEFPCLSFYVQRLLEPSKYPEKSSAVFISSGKCGMCGSQPECPCLYDPSGSKSTNTSEMTPTSLGMCSSGNSYDRFCKNAEKLSKAEGNLIMGLTEKQYEEHWVHNCLKTHMLQLRKIYTLYAELYCSEKNTHPNLSMGKIALWQLMRDTGIHRRGISLAQFERYIANNKSAFIEAPFYPFERIEIFQFIHALLEISWHLYTKLDDVETDLMRGRLAGGLHRLLVRDIYPNAGKLVGSVSTTYRDLLPIYSIYQLYCDLGEPHTVKQFLRATCIPKGTGVPKPIQVPKRGSESITGYSMIGMNAITVGERLSYIPINDPLIKTCSPRKSRTYEDDFARELFALRHLGAPTMLSIIANICPSMKDGETDTIVDMDYELTFLEFYEILLEATRVLLYAKKLSAEEFEDFSVKSQTDSCDAKYFTQFRSLSSNDSRMKTRRMTWN